MLEKEDDYIQIPMIINQRVPMANSWINFSKMKAGNELSVYSLLILLKSVKKRKCVKTIIN